MRRLVDEGIVEASGRGRGRGYRLKPIAELQASYRIGDFSEDDVWEKLVRPVVADLPRNLIDIWHHGTTEMVNNAIDHSEAGGVTVFVERNARLTSVVVVDLGVGIFTKIQRAFSLPDPRDSLLELAKGKLTTDPTRHSGEGIFFTSRMFDSFWIISQELYFTHKNNADHDYLYTIEGDQKISGTVVSMKTSNVSECDPREVFQRYSGTEEMNFDKTVVPVRLAMYEGDKLVSRSQAKRLTARFERFRLVVLDFEGVDEIGQAFADELFRVFQSQHPKVSMLPSNMTPAVEAMYKRVATPQPASNFFGPE
jgi:anti-sigma regulatory factor (Ser/Thr protein kinase)